MTNRLSASNMSFIEMIPKVVCEGGTKMNANNVDTIDAKMIGAKIGKMIKNELPIENILNYAIKATHPGYNINPHTIGTAIEEASEKLRYDELNQWYNEYLKAISAYGNDASPKDICDAIEAATTSVTKSEYIGITKGFSGA